MSRRWTSNQQSYRKQQRAPTGCALWFVRLFIMPHTIAGIYLICNALLTFLWAIAGSNVNGQVTQAWWSQGKKSTTYHIEYAYKYGLSEHRKKDTVSKSFYDELPGSMKGPGPLPQSAQIRQTYPVTLRVFTFGPLWHASPLPPVSSNIASQALGAIFFALFWNGILSVFLYQFWIKPIRMRRQTSRETSALIPESTRHHS
jgi:hypothetical protein